MVRKEQQVFHKRLKSWHLLIDTVRSVVHLQYTWHLKVGLRLRGGTEYEEITERILGIVQVVSNKHQDYRGTVGASFKCL